MMDKWPIQAVHFAKNERILELSWNQLPNLTHKGNKQWAQLVLRGFSEEEGLHGVLLPSRRRVDSAE